MISGQLYHPKMFSSQYHTKISMWILIQQLPHIMLQWYNDFKPGINYHLNHVSNCGSSELQHGEWQKLPVDSSWLTSLLTVTALSCSNIFTAVQTEILLERCWFVCTLMCILARLSRLSVVWRALSGPKGTSCFNCSRYNRSLARLQ